MRGTSLSFTLLNQTPFGIFLIERFAIIPELSATLNVGLNVAPRKITKRLSLAISVNALPFIITVGASLSGFFAVS